MIGSLSDAAYVIGSVIIIGVLLLFVSIEVRQNICPHFLIRLIQYLLLSGPKRSIAYLSIVLGMEP